MTAALVVRAVSKTFTLHTQRGVVLPVLRDVSVSVRAGECVALGDPSGSGKSTLLRAVYGTCRVQAGEILVRQGAGMVDVTRATPRALLGLRRSTIGYVSQFLRVIPRVPAVDVIVEPLRALGVPPARAVDRAMAILERLRIPERLWTLSPVTFSGGEQQRVNVARALVAGYPVLLLDEPTASLDADSRRAVIELIYDARQAGAAVLGAFHDVEVRDALGSRVVRLGEGGPA